MTTEHAHFIRDGWPVSRNGRLLGYVHAKDLGEACARAETTYPTHTDVGHPALAVTVLLHHGTPLTLAAFLKRNPEWREAAGSMHHGRNHWTFRLERAGASVTVGEPQSVNLPADHAPVSGGVKADPSPATASPAFRLEDVQDPNFTGGLSPVEYLDRLHAGTLGEPRTQAGGDANKSEAAASPASRGPVATGAHPVSPGPRFAGDPPLVDVDPGDEDLLGDGDELCLECGHVKGCATCSDIHEDAEQLEARRDAYRGDA